MWNAHSALKTALYIYIYISFAQFQFIKYFRGFLKNVSQEYKDTYAAFTWKLLKRTMSQSMRYHPANRLEYEV